MPKDTFQVQITILGIIDYISDVLKDNQDRKEVRDSILAAIQSTLINALLEKPETSEVLKQAVIAIPKDASFETAVQSVQQSLQNKQVNIDLTPVLKESAKQVLNDFVNKVQRPELCEQINGLL